MSPDTTSLLILCLIIAVWAMWQPWLKTATSTLVAWALALGFMLWLIAIAVIGFCAPFAVLWWMLS